MNRFQLLPGGTLAVALVATLAACGQPADERAGSPAAQPPASAATPTAPGLVPLAWAPIDDELADSLFGPRADSSDPGVGLVALREPGFPPRFPRADTLLFRSAPRAEAPPVAALVLEIVDSTSWRYAMLGPAGTRINVKEYAYESSGVPVDSVAGPWARAVVGWDTAGARVLGWADATDTARVELVQWAEHLRTRAWYFLAPDSARVYTSLADTASPGAPLPTSDPEKLDIEPIETRGRWMRMRLLFPYNKCEDPGADTAAATRREVWVEYLDRRGRPRVFYPSRGC